MVVSVNTVNADVKGTLFFLLRTTEIIDRNRNKEASIHESFSVMLQVDYSAKSASLTFCRYSHVSDVESGAYLDVADCP